MPTCWSRRWIEIHRVETAPGTLRPRVLMLHHHYAWKGVADGMEAVAQARRDGAALWLVGFGVRPPRAPLGYSGCDIYLCPSWDEGLGMPSMEAMACGAALVTTEFDWEVATRRIEAVFSEA